MGGIVGWGAGGRSRRVGWVVMVGVGLAGCESGTGPRDVADGLALSLQVMNSVEQIVGAQAGESPSARITVFAPGYVTHDELGRIQSLMVVWPDGVTKTSVDKTFSLGDGGASAQVTLPGKTLTAGTYMLEARLAGGNRVTAQETYDGSTIGPVDVGGVVVDGAGVQMTWKAPDVSHDWRLSLTGPGNGGVTTTVDGGSGHCTGGKLTARVDYEMTVGRPYTLELRLQNDFNVRMVRMQVQVGPR